MINSLHNHCWVRVWKNFENRRPCASEKGPLYRWALGRACWNPQTETTLTWIWFLQYITKNQHQQLRRNETVSAYVQISWLLSVSSFSVSSYSWFFCFIRASWSSFSLSIVSSNSFSSSSKFVISLTKQQHVDSFNYRKWNWSANTMSVW